MVRALAALAVGAAVLMVLFSGREDGAGALECQGGEPFAFETFEAYDNVGLYLSAIELAAEGKAVTFAATPAGEPHGLEYPGLLTGSADDRIGQEPDPALRIPPTLLKSIVWVESKFQNAHRDVPYGGVGQALRSPDCGFGLGQITSGMANYTRNPTVKQTLVGTHFLFNVAEAANILADKWNYAARVIAGKGDPAMLEDWYYAVMAYNGFWYTNHPLYDTDHQYVWLDWFNHPQNSFRDPLRGDVWHCEDRNAPMWLLAGIGESRIYVRSDYTYPELVYGCIRYPPEYPARLLNDERYAPRARSAETPAADGETPPEQDGETPPKKPDEGTPPEADEETPPETAEPGEEAPEETSAADPWVWPAPGADGMVRLWQPVNVHMPDHGIPAVRAALEPQIYINCESAFWTGGCPAMHFPTSFPDLGITPHRDPTPPADPALLDRLLGKPRLRISGPADVAIAIGEDGTPGSVEVLVENRGSWIAPYRIETSHSWILVRRSDLPAYGRLHGGVAIGAETTVMVCTAASCGQEITKRGHDARLAITLDLDELPEGEDVEGWVRIEPLAGEGAARRIVVRAGPGVEATTEGEALPEDEDEPDGDGEEEDNGERKLEHRIVVPGLARDEGE